MKQYYLAFLLMLSTCMAFGNTDTLDVAVYDAEPFGFWEESKGIYGGIMVELWEDIAEELDYVYRFHREDMEGLLLGLEKQKYDLALGAISITPNREERVDFTQAVNPSGTGIAVASNTWNNRFQSVWKPIILSLLKLVGLIVLLLLISAVLVWLVERGRNMDPSERAIRTLADGFWWAAVTMTTVGYGDKVPHTRLGKAFGVIWIFFGIILFSLFTANASAIFTADRISSHIETLEDLKASNRIGAVANSSGAEFLERERIPYAPFDNIEMCLRALVNKEVECVVNNVPVLHFHNNQSEFFGKIAVSDRMLLKNNMGIALQENSPLRESIDLVLLEKISEPKWQQTLYRYLGQE